MPSPLAAPTAKPSCRTCYQVLMPHPLPSPLPAPAAKPSCCTHCQALLLHPLPSHFAAIAARPTVHTDITWRCDMNNFRAQERCTVTTGFKKNAKKCKSNLPTKHQGVHKNSFRSVRAFQNQIGIKNSWFLRRGENRSTRRKTSLNRAENQQQALPTYDAGSGNQTRDTLVGGECSHH